MKRITGVFVLIVFLAIISGYALLPYILTSFLTLSLQNVGLQVDELSMTQITTDHIEIQHAQLTAANGTTIDLEQLSVAYSISQLVSGTAESISVQQVDIHLTDNQSDLFETLSSLHHLLENDLTTIVPLTSVIIHSLALYDAQEKSLLHAVATLKQDKAESDEKTLKMELGMQWHNGETRHLHIVQQQAGQWKLQAVDSDGSMLVDARFQQAQAFPLSVKLNASLKQLKPWSLLFGLPLPEYQAITQVRIQLKPDYNQKTVQFELDATSSDIHEPEITLQSVTAAMTGKAAIREGGQIELTTHTDFSMAGLKRGKLSADTLEIGFDAQLLVTKAGIQGSLMPGLNIKTLNLNLFDNRIEKASLESVTEQHFNWYARSASWQFEKNSVRVKIPNVFIGNTLKLTEGAFDLTHTAWRYPLKGKTHFELTGTAQNTQQNNLQLADSTLKLSGDIIWKIAQNPTSISADIRLATQQIRHKELSAENALLTAKTHLTFNQNTIHTSFDETSQLSINNGRNKSTLGTTHIDSIKISFLNPLNMQWNHVDMSLDIESNQMKFSHKGVVAEQTTIRSGNLNVSFDSWNTIKQPELTGILSSDSLEIVTKRQTFELKKIDTDFTINGSILTLAGQSVFQLTNSKIHFDLLHNMDSRQGSVTYQSDTQSIASATRALKKTIPNWPHKLRLLGGTTSLSGKAKWQNTDFFADAMLKLSHINGRYGKTSFSGLDSSIDLDLLPTLKGKARFVRIALINTGGSNQTSTTYDFNDWDDVITPELVALILGNNSGAVSTGQRLKLKLKETDARLTINGPRFILKGKSTLQLSNSRIIFDLSYNVASGRGSATYRSNIQDIALATRALKKMTPNWPPELHLLSGTTSVSGKSKWQNADISATAILKLDHIGGRYREAYFSGLDSHIDLNLLPIFKGKSRFFRIELIDIGLPINKLSALLIVEKTRQQKKPVITLHHTHAQLLNGTVSGNRIKLDLNQPSNDFTLAFKGLDLAELIKLHQFEGLDAIGKLSGTLPIQLRSEGVSISNGTASADKPGGSISYIPQNESNTLKSITKESDLVLDVLRDFQYNKIDAIGKYKPDGQLQVKLEIKGKSPQYDKNRPVHLNLNLDQNILSLLRSVRAIEGLNQRIDQTVQKYYTSRQR